MWARTSDRLGLTWLLLPIAVAAAVAYLGSLPGTNTGYGLSEQVAALSTGVLVLPFLSAACAVAGSRLRRSRVLVTPPQARSATAVAVGAVASNTLATVLVLVMAMAVVSGRATGDWSPDIRLVLVASLQVAAYAALGLGLGLRLPPVVGLPVALAAPYLLIAFPPAMTPLWLRHLTYVSTNCCQIDEDLSWAALSAHVLFLLVLLAVGLALTRASMLHPWSRRLRYTVGPAVAIALVGGCVLVHSGGAALVDRRPGGPVCRPVGSQDLCLWPEHESDRGVAEPLIRSAQAIARAEQVPLPRTLTEAARPAPRWPRSPYAAPMGGSENDEVAAVADALAPACSSADAWSDARAERPEEGQAQAWALWWRMRLSHQPAPPDVREDIVAAAARLEASSPAERRADHASVVARCTS